MKDMDSLLAQVLAFRPNRLVPPFDLQGHIPFVAWLVKELQPATFVQLGTQSGNLYFAACQTVAENSLPTRCWAVGTWQAEELAQRHSVQQEAGASDYNRQHFGAFSGLLRMGDAQALPRFAPGSIDLLLIDGRYSPETVRNEYESWRDRLSDHAVVLLVGIEQADSGAAALWQQLQPQYPHLAFAHAQGLGVLAVGGNVPKAFQQALQACATPEARNQLAGVADMLLGAQIQAGMQAQIEALTAQLAERDEQCAQLQRTQAELQQKLDGLQRV
ncbi:MAG: class I SAM-dependent methyltransferase, partial [Lautropia sp.]